MTADEIQAKFAEVLENEIVYVPDDPIYIGDEATEADLDEYVEFVREMTGVEPVRTAQHARNLHESEGMIALQDVIWDAWCSR